MRPRDRGRAQQLDEGLRAFDRDERPLPGIRPAAHRAALLKQLVESIHRIEYISVIRTRDISDLRADPSSDLFDPVKAAVLFQRRGQIDEAFWMVFLFVHFGKNLRTGWRLARDVYGGLGRITWDWARTSSKPERFCRWLADNEATLRGGDGVSRHFGNHRKYQSLDATSDTGTGAAVQSYVEWVNPPRTHQMLFDEAQQRAGGDPRAAFDYLYRSMTAVASFGRTAKFDYLTMVGKLELAPIEPGSTYMQGATGPVSGARLLFGGSKTAKLRRKDLDAWLVELGAYLDVGMQVLEDALCNWQKSPTIFKGFRG